MEINGAKVPDIFFIITSLRHCSLCISYALVQNVPLGKTLLGFNQSARKRPRIIGCLFGRLKTERSEQMDLQQKSGQLDKNHFATF